MLYELAQEKRYNKEYDTQSLRLKLTLTSAKKIQIIKTPWQHGCGYCKFSNSLEHLEEFFPLTSKTLTYYSNFKDVEFIAKMENFTILKQTKNSIIFEK